MWLWDAPSNDLLGSHVGNAGEIYTIAYGPLSLSSALIAVGGSGDTMALWDLITGQQREPVQADADVRSLNFVAEGRVLVVDQDEVAAFWDVRFSRLVGTLGSYTSPVRDITLNPDQTVLASAYEDGVIKLWDMNAATIPADEPAPEGTADALAETFTSEDGSITFSYPAGWSAAQETGSPLISLANGPDVLEAFSSGGTFQPGEVLVYIHTPEAVSGYLSAQQAAPAAESARLVANAYIQALSEPFSYPVDVTLGSLSGVRAQTVGGSYDGLIYVLDLGDGSYLAIVAASMTDNLAPFEATLDAVVASVSLAE